MERHASRKGAAPRIGLARGKLLRRIGAVPRHVLLSAMSLIFCFPLFWMVSTSLKSTAQIMAWPPVWLPWPLDISHYPDAFAFQPFFLYIVNTVRYALLSVVGIIISCSLVAYGFSRIDWPERNVLFIVMLATMMLPFQVVMVPLFILFSRLGWTGSFKPLIVPAFFGGAFNIFLLRQFFMTIPLSLSEAAYLDGAREFRIFRSVILPLSKPALVTVALFQFLYSWNDLQGPLIYLNRQTMYTVSLGLQMYVSQYGTLWGLMMAAATVATAPIIVLFFLAQRTFIQGITLTGVKG